MRCPKCDYENGADALFCGLCAEVLRKEIRPVTGTGNKTATAVSAGRAEILRSGKLCFITFLASLFVIKQLYLLWFPFRFITVFAHEAGHTVLSWLFGYFTIPAVNPFDTGGVAISFSFNPWVPWFVLAGLAYITYLLRSYVYGLIAGILLTGFYAAVAFTPARDWLIAGGGILGEYLLAGVCLYACLFGKSLKFGDFEKGLYGVLGWFTLKQTVLFLYALRTDHTVYESYIAGSSWQAGMTGDLAKIAFDMNYRFSMNSFQPIVTVFLLLGIVPILIIASLAIGKYYE